MTRQFWLRLILDFECQRDSLDFSDTEISQAVFARSVLEGASEIGTRFPLPRAKVFQEWLPYTGNLSPLSELFLYLNKPTNPNPEEII